MWRGRSDRPRSDAMCLVVPVTLALVLSAVSLPACGSDATATSQTTTSEAGEVGKSLQSNGWTVTLVDQPELTKQLGSGTGDETMDMGGGEGMGRVGVRIAEGMWLSLTVEITNDTGDLAMLPRILPKVADVQGGEYQRAGMMVQDPLINADERWERQENQLIQWVFETNLPREGPLVFDVPEKATGLKLVMEGTDETIELGF